MAEATYPKSYDNLQEFKTEPLNYTAEIRQMMYGFGDSHEPMMETVKIVEEVTLREMRSLMQRAYEIADMRCSKCVTAEDFIFLLRKDKIKLQRLIKYLKMIELKANIYKTVETDSLDLFPEEGNADQNAKFSHSKFIESINNIGDMLHEKIDYTKQNRCLRAEMMSRKLDEARYIEYSKARCVSFANKNRHKFSDWIGINGDFTVSKSGYTVLGYLAYETVAQIIDIALIIRQDQNKIQGDSIGRLRSSYPNPITYKPYQYTTPIMTKPITPSEVSEALRRYWSPQFDITGPFQRWSLQANKKFLAV